jgi:16S rRNA processing protein RimM
VRLKSSTSDPLAIASYNPLLTADGRRLVLTKVRPAPGATPDILIALVQGVATREAAEALNRVAVFVERERLPPPEDEDEFLLADLVGLGVERPDGTPLGRVVGVPNYGGGDLLEIAPLGRGPTALLPFTKAFVPVVDLKGGRVVAEAPEDLFAPAKPEPDDPDAPTDTPRRRPRSDDSGAPTDTPRIEPRSEEPR